MYQIFFDDYPIYDPRDDELIIRKPAVHLAVGEAGEMSFVIDPDHPYAGRLTKLKGVVELRAEGVPIFRGRITKDRQDFNLSREIEAEGLLACLNDSIIPPFNFPGDWAADPEYETAAENGNVVEFFLGWLLEQHNAQVGPAQQITLGNVTVSDPNNYINRAASDYQPTLATIRGKLEEVLGGHLLADYSGETTVLHYYADLPFVNTQVVEYGENLLDLINEADATETYTAILPLGQDGLTLAALPDGEVSPGYVKAGKIIYSEGAEEEFGSRIIRPMEWKDVTQASNLQTKALTVLSTGATLLTQTITVKAVDLGSVRQEGHGGCCVVGQAVAGMAVVGTQAAPTTPGPGRFVVGRYVEIKSAPHNFSALYPLVELEPDILNPGNTLITFGSTIKSASSLAQSSQAAAREQLAVQRIELGQQHETITQQQESFEQQQAALAQQQAALDQATAELAAQQAALAEQQAALDQAQAELEEQKTGLNQQQATIGQHESSIAEQQAAIDQAQAELDQQQAAINQTQTSLGEQQAALDQQQAALDQAQADIDQARADLDEVPTIIQTQVTSAIQTSESIIYSALERYVETSNFEEFQQTVESEFALMADELILRFTEATDQTRVVDGDLQRTLETLSKYFVFDQNGLTIKAGENTMQLTLDNDVVSFKRNGEQFGWWDGVDFHTGNIVIGVTERAQFGNFAFVPRSNGSLSFLKVGG